MHVLILGAAGMVGRKLIERLAREGGLGGKAITRLTAADVVDRRPSPPSGTARSASSPPSATSPRRARRRSSLPARPDVIFHLAAIVSGEAEADFDKGYRINLDGTRQLFEAIRRVGGGYEPRLVFTSSIAVFGAPFPDAIDDEFFTTPLTSYGTQKAIGELLLSDYTPARLPRRRRHPAADDLRAARQAQQGRLRVLLQHHPRAAGRRGRRPAGARRRAALARLAALGGRLPDPRGDPRHRARSARGAT